MKKKIGLIFALFLVCISFGLLNSNVTKAEEKQETNNLTPIHKYTFDNDNGDVVVDTGSLAGVDGKFDGKANGSKVMKEDGITFRKFNGKSDHVKFNESLNYNGKRSIKFKFRTKSERNMVLLDNSDGANLRNYGFCIGIRNGKLWYSEVCGNGNFGLTVDEVNDNKWHEVLITWDGSTKKDGAKLYFDDFSKPVMTSTAQTTNSYNSSFNFTIGKGSLTNDFYFDGDLSEIEIYNDVVDYSIQAGSITLDKMSMDLLEGSSDRITATVLPEDATNKNIIWSSSDESIAKVDENGNVTAIKEGQATITAKVENTDLAATCKVNVTKPVEENKNNAILSISLVNGATKEYDVSMEEVDKFINWFEERSSGNGPSLYSFNKKISPYKSVKEYIVHDKIASFEVREYEATK